MPYAIMRFEKRKGGPASAIEKHHERKKPRYASNPDVDTDRSHLNYHLVEPRHKYYAEIQSRIEQAQRKNPKLKFQSFQKLKSGFCFILLCFYLFILLFLSPRVVFSPLASPPHL